TEGAGGGTVCSAALYYDQHEVVDETLNIKFLEASEALLKADLRIHAMTDVTNGGIRGDAKEISYTAGVKLTFQEESMRRLVNPRVLEMLDRLEIDYLGVSIDALLIIAPPEEVEAISSAIRAAGVEIEVIGRVEEGEGAYLDIDGQLRDFSPRFREAAYTPIKKAIGQEAARDVKEMKRRVDEAAREAVEKKRRFVERIRHG
ncbi:AIR synthase-related protein, partial [Methanothrix sp.]